MMIKVESFIGNHRRSGCSGHYLSVNVLMALKARLTLIHSVSRDGNRKGIFRRLGAMIKGTDPLAPSAGAKEHVGTGSGSKLCVINVTIHVRRYRLEKRLLVKRKISFPSERTFSVRR